MGIPSLLPAFRQKVHQKFRKRADAALDLVDAVTTAGVVASPVALSEEPSFRRTFSMVYDVLEHGEVDVIELGKVLYAQPADCATMAGYEVYAVDATDNPRPEAETLSGRMLLKSDKDAPAVPGWKFSWLVRLVQHGTSWVAPQAVEQIPVDSTANQVAGGQVVALDKQSMRPKGAVLDSGYFNHFFLALCVALKTVIVLVRMRHNCALYEQPKPKPAKSKGAPRKHGVKFKLNKPARVPDRTATLSLGPLTVVLTAWHGLHLKKVATLVGMALRVEFQKADGTPRYQRPLWLFWTGPLTVALGDICLMYLWRFAIEHAFRFMKQHLGLNANCSTQATSIHFWMQVCALAYWQLLLMRHDVADLRPAWHARTVRSETQPLTPGQVQRGALRFLLKLGSPAATPRPAGKGRGRPKGYRPARRARYPVVRKTPKPAPKAQTAPPAAPKPATQPL
ncbi:MAG: transposase [Chloroflexi bacterium]|nr:transposase [Chloroflexota bacterium]